MGSRDPLLEFWDPLISPGRMKLETSNLAQRWTAVSNNKKCKIWPKGVMWESGGVTWPTFCSFGTPLSPKRLRLGTLNLHRAR